MEAHRFDALARAVTVGAKAASRRRLLQVLPGLAAGGIFPWLGSARALEGDAPPCPTPAPAGLPTAAGAADAPAPTSAAAGSNGATATPTTVAAGAGRPAQVRPGQVQVRQDQALPAQIHAGVCGQIGADPAFPLIDVLTPGAGGGTPTAGAEFRGLASALAARVSATVVDVTLDDLLDSPHAIDVRVSGEDAATSVACGDIGGVLDGPLPGTELAVGLIERGGSGFSGIAWLRDEGERTLVYVFLAQGLTPVAASDAAADGDTSPAFQQGTTVIVAEDGVNMRAAPTTDAEVVATLSQGEELTATGPAADGWVPVRDPRTGRRGYVAAEFLTVPE